MDWMNLLPAFTKDPSFQGSVVVGALSILFTLIKMYWDRKGRVGWGVSHGHTYLIPNKPSQQDQDTDQVPRLEEENSNQLVTRSTLVKTVEIWIQNIGGATVKNTEIVLNFQPQHFDIWPPLQYEITNNPDGRFIITAKSLHKRQYFTLSMLVVDGEIPNVTGVSWENGLGKEVLMGPQQILSTWLIHTLRILLMIGLASVVYFVSRLLFW